VSGSAAPQQRHALSLLHFSAPEQNLILMVTITLSVSSIAAANNITFVD
jgi:hypothetical protein